MTAAEIIAEIDDAGFDDKDTSIKLSALNEVYWEVCGLEPWPFLEKTVTLAFDGSSGVPTNLTGMQDWEQETERLLDAQAPRKP